METINIPLGVGIFYNCVIGYNDNSDALYPAYRIVKCADALCVLMEYNEFY
jgi:hypothetical protein